MKSLKLMEGIIMSVYGVKEVACATTAAAQESGRTDLSPNASFVKETADALSVAERELSRSGVLIGSKNTVDREVAWKSLNTKLATINRNGFVTAKSAGGASSVTPVVVVFPGAWQRDPAGLTGGLSRLPEETKNAPRGGILPCTNMAIDAEAVK